MICPTCGSDKGLRSITKYNAKLDKSYTVCNICAHASMASEHFKDADGNTISLPDHMVGKFSYAIGEVIPSKRKYAAMMRENNLVQKGTEHQQ